MPSARRSSARSEVSQVYAVVLAAGRGERFGGEKLAAPLHGRPLLSYPLDVIRAAQAAGVIARACAVVPDGRPELSALAEAAGVEPVLNADSSAGLSGSLRLGFAWLERIAPPVGPAAALVLLGDEPHVRADVLRRLVSAWKLGNRTFVRPRYADQPADPGHPTLVDRSLWPLARELTGDAGFGAAVARRGGLITLVDVPGHNPDVDTRADLLNLEEPTR